MTLSSRKADLLNTWLTVAGEGWWIDIPSWGVHMTGLAEAGDPPTSQHGDEMLWAGMLFMTPTPSSEDQTERTERA